ncbi:hypothetical protein FAUST_11024 [Fusarium austroamericanum]|uniref:Uncharacterized protein n=1 Tax=Fusarium austroamericanum TaxID=282268 RepID=A0AAN5YZQ2_FUSAU|nr:hypothetical protein FAUST_11024 [Fusarium austroamericanum]
MSQNSKNGNIMSFFKPKTKSPTPKATKSSTPDPPSSPMLPSSPLEQKAATPVKKNLSPTPKRVIQASDDEDDFGASSDDSLEDISTMIGRGRPAKATQSPARNLFATPKAKRTAVEFRTSPLAIISKHKYDLKALAKDARQDNAITASSMRAKAFSDFEDQVDVQMTTDKASLDAMEGIVKNNTGQDAQKVMRAVKRSETGQSELRYCFFSQDYTLPPPNPAPKKFNKGHWKLLTKGDQKTREQHLASGVPLTLLHLQGGLPEELFDWILNDIYLIEHCITPQRLEELLYRFGASSELGQRDSELDVSKPGVEPYEGRDWSPLSSFLSLLAAIPPYMSEDSVVYASQALLRMSMDRFLIYDIGLLTTYEITISILLEAIPQPRWDTFCFETCTLLHTLIKAQCIRTNALACLPLSKARAHEMRRRLAVVFLFDDPALGRCHPDDTVTIRGIIKRLDRSDFFVGPKTDFAELQANIILLNIAVDDGSFAPSDDPEHEKQFNKDIDELAVRLREIWRKINDSGMKLARTEAKSVIEWVEQRLAHSVRTRRKAKKSIFDLPGQKQDLCLPEQQNYMKNFLRKAPETTSVQAPKQLTSDTEGLKETRNPETIVAKFK